MNKVDEVSVCASLGIPARRGGQLAEQGLTHLAAPAPHEGRAVQVTRLRHVSSDHAPARQASFDMGGGRSCRRAERAGIKLPAVTMGHEIVGGVVGGSRRSSTSAVGASAVVYPWLGCGLNAHRLPTARRP